MGVVSITKVDPLGEKTLRVSVFDNSGDGQNKQVDLDYPTFLDFPRFVEHLEDKGVEYATPAGRLQAINRQSLFESWKEFEKENQRRLENSGYRFRSPARKQLDRLADDVILQTMNDALRECFKSGALKIDDTCHIGGVHGPSVHVTIGFASTPDSVTLAIVFIPDLERAPGQPHGRVETVDTLESANTCGRDDNRIKQWLRGGLEKCRARLLA